MDLAWNEGAYTGRELLSHLISLVGIKKIGWRKIRMLNFFALPFHKLK